MSASVLQTTLAEARAVPASAIKLVVLEISGGHVGGGCDSADGLVFGRRASAWGDDADGETGLAGPCASIITPAASLPCLEEAPVRHSPYPSRLPRPFATMVLTYGTGGATAALTVVGLCTCGDAPGAGNS